VRAATLDMDSSRRELIHFGLAGCDLTIGMAAKEN
jgi:hypothetical protein